MKKYRISRNNMAYGQMGMQQPSQEEMMMQQQQAQQQPAPAQQDPQKQVMQLAQQVSAIMQKGESADAVTQQLLEGNVPPQAIAQAFEMLVQQGVVDESEMQTVVQVLQSSQGDQQQAQPSEEEMMAMQQQQAAAQQPPMARAGYVKQQMKARAGMSVDQEAGFASATNLIADKNMQKNNLLKFTQDNVAANQFGQEYDQMYNGGGLEQARYGRGKARRQARRDVRTADQGDNFAKNQGMRSRQLARRAVREMPDVYSRADKRSLREGLESGEFDKYDVYRGVDVFNPQSKPGYPEVDRGSFDQTMIPGKDWGMQPSVEEGMPAEETSTESNVITDFDDAYDYKNENGIIYTRKKGASDWTKVDSDSNAGRAIRKRVYGEDDVTFDEGPDYIDADATGVDINPYEDMEGSTMEDEETYDVDEDYWTKYYAGIANKDPNYVEASDNPTGGPYGVNKEFLEYVDEGGSEYDLYRSGGEQDLEMARFGRGRARRQARRADRQGRRALRQADRAMRGVYDNIAFPPGVSPMMAGMPMMGPNGAGSDMMQFYGKRGLLGGLREFSMNMPINAGRGMFFNGMFNPYGTQGGYNDMRYKITYPGQESEVTANEEAKKQVEGAKKNQVLEDNTKQKGQQEEEEKEEKTATETADTTEEKDEAGISKNCGENASVNEAGQCQCNKGYVRNPNIQTFSCISEAELAAGKDDEDPEGTNWVYIALGAGTIGGGIWALRKIAPKVRALISKNPAASKTAREALLKQIVNQFPDGTQMASGTKLLGSGAPIPQTNIAGTKMTEAELRASREAAQQTTEQTAKQAEKRIVQESLKEGSDAAKRISGKSPKRLGPARANLSAGARKISNTERAFLMREVEDMTAMTTKQAQKIARRYGVKAVKGRNAKQLQKAVFKILKSMQAGGSVDPNLYMFTGGGAPDYVDYFSNGGYYEDGGFPQYENVYDPYMPMAENGMTMVDRPYQTGAEYGNEYASYPGPYAEPMITDSIRNSVTNSGRLMDGVTGEEIERSTIAPIRQYGGYQEGDVVDMTEAQLGAFLMGGGQVEFVD